MASLIDRREMLSTLSAVGALALGAGGNLFAAAGSNAPVRVITRGPKHHWFGYYDKFEFDPTDRYVLGMEVDFEHRSPRADDEIRIGMVDLEDGDRWIDLGATTAWCWQQGCMLQWLPGSGHEIVWNDREDGQYVCRILDIKSGKRRTVGHPIYSLSTDGRTAVAPDLRRINDVRPGYGYVGFADPDSDELAPDKSGIVRIDLETGKHDLIISLAQIAAMGTIPKLKPGIKHYFNHLLFSPDGSRFVFLHRWRYPEGNRLSRMITARPDGSDIYILDDNGWTSHFIWTDNRHILAWSDQPSHGQGYYMFEDRAPGMQNIGKQAMPTDGHCNCLPESDWIVNDTYPDADRMQEIYLYYPERDARISLGKFLSPSPYTGEWRCDTHPRLNRDGTKIVFDSPHGDEGRQLHLIDIGNIVS
jgi:hypothetical protein